MGSQTDGHFLGILFNEVVCYSECASTSEAFLLLPGHRVSPPLAGFFFGETMSNKDRVMNCCRDQARSATEIATLLEMPKQLVKVTLLYCWNRGYVNREKKDRTGKGPKQEYFYICRQ